MRGVPRPFDLNTDSSRLIRESDCVVTTGPTMRNALGPGVCLGRITIKRPGR
jgi:hypothetical protein